MCNSLYHAPHSPQNVHSFGKYNRSLSFNFSYNISFKDDDDDYRF